MNTMLKMQGIHHAYKKGVPVLADFSLEVKAAEIACLLGASGCGKTTALRIIAGFETPSVGEVELGGEVVSSQSRHLPVEKRSIGIVFQDAALFPHLTVNKNIAFGLHQLPKTQQKERVDEMLELVGLKDYGRTYPHQLSGGQQQRIALARAMAPRPKVILLDEPFSNLDASLRESLGRELRAILKAHGMTAVLVTHDHKEAFAMADRVAVVHQGQIRQWDSPRELFQQPKDAYVADFLGLGSWIEGACEGQATVTCAFGQFAIAKEAVRQGKMAVLIRPENISLDPNGIRATLLKAQFQGAHYRCELCLDNGDEFQAFLPASEPSPKAGDMLRFRHQACAVSVSFEKGQP